MEDVTVDQIRAWHSEHMRFKRLLDFLERQMVEFHAGRHPNYELMRDVVHYLHHFADRIHHPREDVAFALLEKRDPEFQIYLNQLLQQHRVIAVAGEALLKHLEDILQDAIIERPTLEAAAALYLVYFRHHLASEENKALPHAAKVLMQEDWTAVAAAVSDIPDPLFGGDVAARYRELYEQITREA